MYATFCSIHPPDGISNEIGVVTKCVREFKKILPSQHDEVLHLTAQMFTFERLRVVNANFTKKKKKKKVENDDDSEESEGEESEIEEVEKVEEVEEVSEDDIPELDAEMEPVSKVTVFENNSQIKFHDFVSSHISNFINI